MSTARERHRPPSAAADAWSLIAPPEGRARRAVRRVWRPLAAVIVGAGLALVTTFLDGRLDLGWDRSIPPGGARGLLTAIATTMITATVVVFWIRGLLVSARTPNFPNRVLSDYLDDPDQQWLMGSMVAVFVYASIVALNVPTARDITPDSPTVSIVVALLGTIGALLAIIYSVSVGTDSLHEQRVLRRIIDTTLATVERDYPAQEADGEPREPPDRDARDATVVRSARMGWLRSVDDERLLAELPPGAVCRRTVRVGTFVSPGERVCLLWDVGDRDGHDEVEQYFDLGETRSPGDDIAFGIRNLVDVALAGAEDASDRTTGREAIRHLQAVLRPLITRAGPAPAWCDGSGRWMIRSVRPDYCAYLDEAFDDLGSAARDPRTRDVLVEMIDNLLDAAEACGRHDRVTTLQRHRATITADDGERDLAAVG